MKTHQEEIEYAQRCFDIKQSGGTLWLIERTDTNEYLTHNFESHKTNRPEPAKYHWLKSTSTMAVSFLTKQDAEDEIKFMDRYFREGGCPCCGYGSKQIPIKILDHEWLDY